MIQCRHCQSRQLDGTLFCTECGASLVQARKAQAVGMRHMPSRPVPAEPAASPSLTLIVQPSGRRISLTLEDELLIGRADDGRGIIPDIDLGRDGGFDAGVSRRHAIVSYRNSTVQIEDLASANGTFVNGRQLAPATPAPLHHGDEVRCGALKLRIELP